MRISRRLRVLRFVHHLEPERARRLDGGGGGGVRTGADASARRSAGPTAGEIDGGVATGADTSAGGRAGGGERSEPPGKRQRAASESDRRREGYPAHRGRPRSGLDRVARPRSGAPKKHQSYRLTVSSRKALSRRATASMSASSHSHSVNPAHPAAVNSSSWSEWRSTLRAIFVCQYSTLVFGRRLPRLQECPCQKHP